MARQESDREDLLREATALVERVELQIADCDEPVVVGFRRDGAASFFFGADPVYQFSVRGELRRGFRAGLLLKAENGRLVALRRERTAEAVQLVRRELSEDDANAFRGEMQRRLGALQAAIDDGNATVLRLQPDDADVIARVRSWLAALPAEIPIAARPHVQ